METKKGIALNQAFGAVLMLVLVAVLVIIAIVIFVNLKGTFTNVATGQLVTDETLTPTAFVANSSQCNFGSFAIVTAVNLTGGLIDADNYTTTSNGNVTNNTLIASGDTTAPWDLNYTFNTGGSACDATDTMISQFGTYPTLVGLVGTIIFLGLVIGVLVASFTFGRKRGV